jgi:hypothetical protein
MGLYRSKISSLWWFKGKKKKIWLFIFFFHWSFTKKGLSFDFWIVFLYNNLFTNKNLQKYEALLCNFTALIVIWIFSRFQILKEKNSR